MVNKIISGTTNVLIPVIAKMYGYASRCVNPQIARRMMTAPLWGNVSMPPADMEAIRCNTSGSVPMLATSSRYFCPMMSRAMLIPPDADPVMPARMLMDNASEKRGFTSIDNRARVID